jgi:hypothetical protein
MTTTMVYRYGLASPHEEADRVFDQFRCAHRYRNELVAIERGRRAAERAMLGDSAHTVAELERAAAAANAAVDDAYAVIRKARAKVRKRAETAAEVAALKAAKEAAKAARAALRDARTALRDDPRVAATRDVLSERALALGRGARALSGLAKLGPHFGAWGTYQLVESAASDSFGELPLYEPDGVTPCDPRFRGFSGDGAVGVQIQGGATAEAVLAGECRQLRITAPDERAWLKLPGNGRAQMARYARHGELRLRLCTDREGTPIYGAWRLDMHRPLPPKAVIKTATVHRRKIGAYARWTLELTVETTVAAALPAARGGAVAVDLGWRLFPDGSIRVAGWADEHGNRGDLRLPKRLVEQLHEPEAIRSQRSMQFDLVQLHLADFLAYAKVPEWFRAATTTLKAWRSAAKMARLLGEWSENRFPLDTWIYAKLEAFVHADRWYWTTETRRREASLGRRLDLYRVFAATLAAAYDTVLLEQFDLRAFAKRPAVTEAAQNETARSNRHLIAPSSLRTAIVNTCRAKSRACLAVPAIDTTRECPACGDVSDRDAAADVVLRCAKCDAAWDQDVEGAAPVMLARWRERPGDAKVLGGARKSEKSADAKEDSESRRERVRRKRQEKLERMNRAREDLGISV